MLVVSIAGALIVMVALVTFFIDGFDAVVKVSVLLPRGGGIYIYSIYFEQTATSC